MDAVNQRQTLIQKLKTKMNFEWVWIWIYERKQIIKIFKEIIRNQCEMFPFEQHQFQQQFWKRLLNFGLVSIASGECELLKQAITKVNGPRSGRFLRRTVAWKWTAKMKGSFKSQWTMQKRRSERSYSMKIDGLFIGYLRPSNLRFNNRLLKLFGRPLSSKKTVQFRSFISSSETFQVIHLGRPTD